MDRLVSADKRRCVQEGVKVGFLKNSLAQRWRLSLNSVFHTKFEQFVPQQSKQTDA